MACDQHALLKMAQLTEHSNNSEKFYKKSPKDQNFLQNFLLPFYNLDFILLQFTLIKRKLSSTYQTTLQSKDFHSKSIMLTLHMEANNISVYSWPTHTWGGPSKKPKHVYVNAHAKLTAYRDFTPVSSNIACYLGHGIGRSFWVIEWAGHPIYSPSLQSSFSSGAFSSNQPSPIINPPFYSGESGTKGFRFVTDDNTGVAPRNHSIPVKKFSV